MNRAYLSASLAIVLLALAAPTSRAEDNDSTVPDASVPAASVPAQPALSVQSLTFAERTQRAEAGDPAAQNNLGYNYAFGIGVQQNNKEALKWLTAAASSGFAPAQVNLAYLYEDGRAGKANLPQALRWFRAAAEQGDATSAWDSHGVSWPHHAGSH